MEDFVVALKSNGLRTSQQTVSGWETGYNLPKIENLPIIAESLHVSIKSLIPSK
ncbi:MAG: helix-turn-helix transcriptional regulator [Planctomycetes bacterium]|nr:helix-turn-helix transcriptional regulator [Planctomycetota bacterium]